MQGLAWPNQEGTAEMKNPAVFLDRDGTVIKEVGYLNSLSKVELLPGVPKALAVLHDAGFKLFIVTNQSGVARGLFTESFVRETHELLFNMLKERGCFLDGFYYCPHHPTEGKPPYVGECNCRKPKPGMVLQAAYEHNLDLTRSWIIGDKKSDILTAKNIGMKAVLVLTGYGRAVAAELEKEGDVGVPVCRDMEEAAKIILRDTKYKEIIT